jgi:hypothetical protein
MLGWFQRLMPHTLLFFPSSSVMQRPRRLPPGLRQMLDATEDVAQHCRNVLRLEEETDGTPARS